MYTATLESVGLTSFAADRAKTRAPNSRMGFGLLVLATGMLFLRPGEIITELEVLPIYEALILACLLVSLPSLLEQLTWPSLIARPISLCVMGILAGFVLSHLANFSYDALSNAGEFAKVALYYLLLVSLVDSPARLRRFLFWVAAFVVILTVLPLLQHHGMIDIPSLEVLEDRGRDPETGEEIRFPRLRGAGIFHDPNDLCHILAVAILVALYGLTDRRSSGWRRLWVIPLGILFYGAALTESRGGFIAIMTGLGVLLISRYGWRKTALMGAIALPIMLMFFGKRQTDLSAEGGTAQERIQLWSGALVALRQSPLLGVGPGNFPKIAGLAAHNSFLHSFAELGLLGGTLFLGAFFVAIRELYRHGSKHVRILDPDLRRMQPFMTAIIAAYIAGMLPLSRGYVIPTYLVLGASAVYLRMAVTSPPLPAARFDRRLVHRLVLISIGFLTATYIFVRLNLRWS